jgi:thiol-disulfide isomerase/thioredoxin
MLHSPSPSTVPSAARTSRAARRLSVLAAALLGTALSAAAAENTPMPAFPSDKPADWIGTPQSWEMLRGHVVLVDVWRFSCGNCRATMPWLREAKDRFAARGLRLVGVHTPAFTFEYEKPKVQAEVERQGLDYPHLLDTESRYWKALGAEYWPTVYLVDRCGRQRLRHIGEIHSGKPSGEEVEAAIAALLDEPVEECGAPRPPAAAR